MINNGIEEYLHNLFAVDKSERVKLFALFIQ